MSILANFSLNRLNPRHSLKARIIWSTAGMVLILSLLLSLLVGYVSGNRIEITRKQSLEQLAFQMADKLEKGMFERYKDIQILSTLETIRQPNIALASQRNLLEELQSIYPDYAWIGLTDNEGNIVVSTGRLLEGVNASQRSWFELSQNEAYVGDVHEALLLEDLLSNSDDEPLRFVDLAAPVQDEQGKFKGVLCAHLSWNWSREVKRSLQESITTKDTLEIFVLSSDGHVLLAPKGFENDKITIPDLPKTQDNTFSYSLEERSLQQEYLTAFAQIKGYRSYPGLNWLIMVRQDKNSAFAPVRSLQRQVLGAGLLLGTLFAMLSWLNARRISAPIVRLSNAADLIRQGETEVEIPVISGRDELATLSKSLIYLISTLNTRQDTLIVELEQRQQAEESLRESENRYRLLSETLERQVKERTVKLDTKQKQLAKLNQELVRSNQELEHFASVASHDLREPLRMITSFTQLLAHRYKEQLGMEADEIIGFIVDNAKRMENLIEDLLAYSRVGSKGKTLTWVNCETVLDRALSNLQLTIQETDARIIRDALPQVSGDETQLIQLFQNIIVNGIRYQSTASPIIHVGATIQEEQWLFWFKDNGIGIAPQHQESIFKIFQRLHTNEEYSGTGMGLAICHKIVQHHEGEMWVDSALKKGATFYFTLPKIN